MRHNLKIAIDFDGTVVEHDYPNVGKDVLYAEKVLRKLVECGNDLIIFTMRSGKTLQDAVEWYKEKKIPLYGINTNPDQHTWTKSPKCLADLYIDDCGINVPITFQNGHRVVDWIQIEKLLYNQGII